MSKCTNCGAELRSTEGFCQECGTTIKAGKTRSKRNSGTKLTFGFWLNLIIAAGIAAGFFYLIWRFR
ncbi:hypothetical protein NEF87_004647 [Candidatus Lokiarchaeum ossiferum]|uniref:Zinc-ribbon domain-containing protein n=1 Tax=Candidatus Lokiarchaeum ossiferum TaxID=2951803 RepID=A0ABY6HXW1_9ARCH|nr:hypothetical protein NEF87_004647 [Candidatus Lokiarchaeum sp. B-35]